MANSGRLYEVAERQRLALLRGERDAASQLVETYGALWQRIRREIDDLLRLRTLAEQKGEVIGPEWLWKQNRLETLLAEVERELRVYAEFASPLITSAQGQAVDAALWHSEELTRVAAKQVGLAINWNRLPTGALNSLIGFTADGSPLKELLLRMGPEAAGLIRDGLIQGVAMGWNPERIARQLRNHFARGLSQALTTCRTEVMRAYREGSHQSYLENDDILEGWIWNSACTPRTCAACWAQHGTLHPFTERLEDHPNGRCVALPAVKDMTGMRSQWRPESGPAQFARLEPHVQRNILGPGKFEAYRAGALRLEDVAGYSESADWGRSLRVRGLREMLGETRGNEFTAWGKAQYGGDKAILREAKRIAERHGVIAQYNGDAHVAQLVTDGLLRLPEEYREALPKQVVVGEDWFEEVERTLRIGSFDPRSNSVLINPAHDYWRVSWLERKELMTELRARRVLSSDDPLHPVLHEFAHAIFRNRGVLRMPGEFDSVQIGTALLVSERAAYSPGEFAAEVFAARLAGRSLPGVVMQLYEAFGGVS